MVSFEKIIRLEKVDKNKHFYWRFLVPQEYLQLDLQK